MGCGGRGRGWVGEGGGFEGCGVGCYLSSLGLDGEMQREIKCARLIPVRRDYRTIATLPDAWPEAVEADESGLETFGEQKRFVLDRTPPRRASVRSRLTGGNGQISATASPARRLGGEATGAEAKARAVQAVAAAVGAVQGAAGQCPAEFGDEGWGAEDGVG